MEFCPECGGIMLPYEEIIFSDEDRYFFENKIIKILKCNSCGYKKDLTEDVKENYSVEKKVEGKDTVIFIGNKIDTRSTAMEICPRCGYNRALLDLKQIKGIAEGPTPIFRCGRCGFTWRDE